MHYMQRRLLLFLDHLSVVVSVSDFGGGLDDRGVGDEVEQIVDELFY
jgi:hypothetical protein